MPSRAAVSWGTSLALCVGAQGSPRGACRGQAMCARTVLLTPWLSALAARRSGHAGERPCWSALCWTVPHRDTERFFLHEGRREDLRGAGQVASVEQHCHPEEVVSGSRQAGRLAPAQDLDLRVLAGARSPGGTLEPLGGWAPGWRELCRPHTQAGARVAAAGALAAAAHPARAGQPGGSHFWAGPGAAS